MKKPIWNKYEYNSIYKIESKTYNEETKQDVMYVYNKYDSYYVVPIVNPKSENYTNKINEYINYADSTGKKESSENDYSDMRIVNNELNWGKPNRSTSYLDEVQRCSRTDGRISNVAESRNTGTQTKCNEKISTECQTDDGFYSAKQLKTKDDVVHFFH